jgi:hypothetical protein
MTFEYDVIEAARDEGTRLVVGSPLRWLTTRGHYEPVVQREAPRDVLAVLDVVHRALGGNARALSRAVSRPLTADLSTADGQLIELDEVQHFTAERRSALSWYPISSPLGFSLDSYRSLIDVWKSRATAVFTRQVAPGFDFSGGRRAQRAYVDTLLDLLAPTFTGQQLIRIPVVDRNAALAIRQLRAAGR